MVECSKAIEPRYDDHHNHHNMAIKSGQKVAKIMSKTAIFLSISISSTYEERGEFGIL